MCITMIQSKKNNIPRDTETYHGSIIEVEAWKKYSLVIQIEKLNHFEEEKSRPMARYFWRKISLKNVLPDMGLL